MNDAGGSPRRARRARRYQIAFSVPAAIGSVAAMAQEGVAKDDTALLTALAVMALGLCCFIAFVVYRMVQSVRVVRRDPLRRVSENSDYGESLGTVGTASSFWRLFRRYLWSSGDSSPGESGGGDWGATGDSGGGDSGD